MKINENKIITTKSINIRDIEGLSNDFKEKINELDFDFKYSIHGFYEEEICNFLSVDMIKQFIFDYEEEDQSFIYELQLLYSNCVKFGIQRIVIL